MMEVQNSGPLLRVHEFGGEPLVNDVLFDQLEFLVDHFAHRDSYWKEGPRHPQPNTVIHMGERLVPIETEKVETSSVGLRASTILPGPAADLHKRAVMAKKESALC